MVALTLDVLLIVDKRLFLFFPDITFHLSAYNFCVECVIRSLRIRYYLTSSVSSDPQGRQSFTL